MDELEVENAANAAAFIGEALHEYRAFPTATLTGKPKNLYVNLNGKWYKASFGGVNSEELDQLT